MFLLLLFEVACYSVRNSSFAFGTVEKQCRTKHGLKVLVHEFYLITSFKQLCVTY